MQPILIHPESRFIGAPKDWDQNRDGPCEGLSVHDRMSTNGDYNTMISAWLPSDEERKAIAAGQPVFLHIVGVIHPVVALTVNTEDASS